MAAGFAAATGRICIVQDADLEVDPAEYPLVIGPIVDGRADVVFLWHRVGNGLLTLLSNMAADLNLTDMETCTKAFRREIIQSIRIQEQRFGFEPEITAKENRMARRPPRHLVHPQNQHLDPRLTGLQPVRLLLGCLATPGSAGSGQPFGRVSLLVPRGAPFQPCACK